MSHKTHHNEEGNVIPSVSQIPGIFKKDLDGFEDWICRGLHSKEEKCCTKAKRDYASEAANLGNDVHSLREAFLKGAMFNDGVPEYHAALFDPVAQFYRKTAYKPLFVEEEMTGAEFGGTLDGAGTFGHPFWSNQRKTFWADYEYLTANNIWPTTESIWVDDLKVKSEIDKASPLQLFGYSVLLEEVHGQDAKWGLIIRREKKLNIRPQIQLKAYYLPLYQEIWNAAFKCYRFLHEK